MTINREDFNTLMQMELEKITELFFEKQREYASIAPLANFELGSDLLFNDHSIEHQYDTLLAYTAKHIAKIYKYQSRILGKAESSLRDIAIYCLIAIIIEHIWKEQQNDRRTETSVQGTNDSGQVSEANGQTE